MSNRTSAQSSRACSPIDGGIRKRVSKACDRCRMKKSKCDGSTPCNKCKADNAICAYGRRKRSYDKVYPKGYVEMLEHQQSQLVLGLQELYRRSTQHGESWDSEQLPEIFPEKSPSTHDLLTWLGALHHSELERNQDKLSETFYDNFYTMQAAAILDHPASMNRETSFDRTHTTIETGQSPIFEPLPDDAWDFLESKQLSTPHISPAPLVESPQVLPKTTSLSTARSRATLSQIPWLQGNLGYQSTDYDAYDPWLYGSDTQYMYTVQPDLSQQITEPAELSVDPHLTLRDRSILNAYRLEPGFRYT